MAAWGTFLGAAAGPIAKKILISLGIGVVTYAGVSTALNAALAASQGYLSGVPAATGAIMAIMGLNTALSILAGALLARATLLIAGKLGKMTT